MWWAIALVLMVWVLIIGVISWFRGSLWRDAESYDTDDEDLYPW